MRLKNNRGVTIIELLIVFIIICIMTGGIVAMIGSFNRSQALDNSLALLLGDLRQAQQFARVQRNGHQYFGLRFYNNLGDNADRQGWKILCYCNTSTANCTEITPPFDSTTTFRVIKSSVAGDNNGTGPEISDNTFFAQGVTLDTTSEFQVNPGAGQLNSIIFISEGSATQDGVNLLNATTNDIKLNIGTKIKTINIIPLTGHAKVQ